MSRFQSLTLALFLVMTASAIACGDDLDCSQDSDCYSREICSAGSCIVGERNNGAVNNGAVNNGVVNNGVVNNGATNNGATNNGAANSCIADLFSVTCEDDENDQFAESFYQSTVGCLTGDELTTLNEMRTELMCGHEQADKYTQLWVGCDNRTFVMEVRFDPKDDMCSADLIDFHFAIDGKNCNEPHEDIQCDRQPDGGMIATVLVHPNRSVNSSNINITKANAKAHFEYDLTVIVR